MNKKVKSSVFLFVAAIVWGFAFVAQKLGGDSVPPFYFNAIRFILGGIVLIPVVMIFEKEKSEKAKLLRTIKAAAICAMFLFVASALQQRGIYMTSAGKGAFITAFYSVLVPVFYFLFFRRKVGMNVWIGAVLAITGIFFLSIKENFTIGTGDILLLVGALFWTGHIISIDLLVKDISPIKFAMFQALFCGIYNFCFAVFTETVTLSAIYSAGIELLYCGIGSTAIAYTCQILGQKDADPTIAPIILSTESLFGALGGALIDGETMTSGGYIGCLLVFAGVVISQFTIKTFSGKIRNKKTDAAAPHKQGEM